MIKIWTWLYLQSKQKIKEHHLKTHGVDIKCPHCNEWFSISGVLYNHKQEETDEGLSKTKCGQCNHISYWNNDIAPFPVSSDKNGAPLTKI